MSGSFRFDGKRIPFEPGDTVGSALHRADVRVVSRSMKYHRPRGLYCCTGSCASCFVAVDGVPNTPACTAAARDGAEIVSQNHLGSVRRDLLRVVDRAYPAGFDPHAAFVRPRFVNRLFVRIVRMLSGWGKAPAADAGGEIRGRRCQHAFNEVIVGGGRWGLERAAAMTGKGRSILLVDERRALGGSLEHDPSEARTAHLVAQAASWHDVTTWTDALAFGIYGDVVAIARGDDLHEVTATHVTITPGTNDAQPVFPGNDLPGILSERGARRLWYAHGVRPGRRIVVDGGPLDDTFARDLAAAGATIVATGDVAEAAGDPIVARARIGDRWHRADTILVARAGVARVELFQQAGCEIGWADGGPTPLLDDGQSTVAHVRGHFTRTGMSEAAAGTAR